MIYLAADVHGHIRLEWLKKELEKLNLKGNDHLIILGDAGIVWSEVEHKEVLDFYESQPFTTLFLDGNHENFTLLNNYPTTKLYGGKVHKVGSKVFHLLRGETYCVEGKTLFVFGGGFSAKKLTNASPVYVWEEEMPSKSEYGNGLNNFERANCTVDFVLTHVPPTKIAEEIAVSLYDEERELNDYLQGIADRARFAKWYFGHCHKDVERGSFVGIYERVVKIGE